jgi:hypothetical protein
MNSLVERFSSNSAEAEIKRAKELFEEEDGAGVMWGSQAGFGTTVGCLPKFTIPAVPDVCLHKLSFTCFHILTFLLSLKHFWGCTQMTMQILRAGLRLSTGQLPLRSDFKEVLLLQLTQGPLPGAMLVSSAL